ncbi:MAG: hypothetical protein IPI21_12715 [Propionivibrio sp.]|nr:hypothetical protein [Propionivibrio sp.]
MFFATFMAAGVGNALWHFLRQIDSVAKMGLVGAIESFTSYLFYCAVLATGIGISQVRASVGIRARPVFSEGYIPSCSYGRSLYACMFLVVKLFTHTLLERLLFMASLFGVA